VVHDLTGRSYKEIVNTAKEEGGELCGRIDTNKLRKSYIAWQVSRSSLRVTRNFFLALLFSFGASLFSIKDASAGNYLNRLRTVVMDKQDTAKHVTVKGIVRDKENKELLPFTNVMLLKGDSVLAKTVSDLDGNFSIDVPANEKEGLALKIVYIGYNTLIIKNFTAPRKGEKVLAELTQNEVCIIEGIIIWEVPLMQDGLDGTKKTFDRDQIRRIPH
jgi:hypothetical protein